MDEQPLAKRGWLRNGNPPGDFTKAKRCGARSKRSGNPCRQPAMKNGRCRLHGGLSTGPKTKEGLARSIAARLKHGAYSQTFKNEVREINQAIREANRFLKEF